MIGLFLVNQRGYTVLKTAIENSMMKNIAFVVSYEEENVQEKYYHLIKQLCCDNKIKFYERKDFDFQALETNVTHFIAVGWQYLISKKELDKKNIDLIVFHDSLLPRYRGFAPTPTAMINGESEVGVTALYAVDEMDAGEIILQRKMEIGEDEYISEVIDRQSLVYADMVQEILESIENNNLNSYAQDEKLATFSIWRDEADCQIDWRKSSLEIYRLIRAVGNPYMGAYSFMDGEKIKILRACLTDDVNFEVRNPGKIWSLKDGVPTIVCGKGMLKILESEWENGEKVVYNRLRKRFM